MLLVGSYFYTYVSILLGFEFWYGWRGIIWYKIWATYYFFSSTVVL